MNFPNDKLLIVAYIHLYMAPAIKTKTSCNIGIKKDICIVLVHRSVLLKQGEGIDDFTRGLRIMATYRQNCSPARAVFSHIVSTYLSNYNSVENLSIRTNKRTQLHPRSRSEFVWGIKICLLDRGCFFSFSLCLEIVISITQQHAQSARKYSKKTVVFETTGIEHPKDSESARIYRLLSSFRFICIHFFLFFQLRITALETNRKTNCKQKEPKATIICIQDYNRKR